MELSLVRIAEVVEGEIKGDRNKYIRGVAPFDAAKGDEITLAGNAKFLKRMDDTDAGAVIVPRDFETSSRNIVQVDNPQLAFAMVLELFHPPSKPETGISSGANIGKKFV